MLLFLRGGGIHDASNRSGPARLDLAMLLSRVSNWGIKLSKSPNPGTFTGECCGAISKCRSLPKVVVSLGKYVSVDDDHCQSRAYIYSRLGKFLHLHAYTWTWY